jgi:hypothetical protein
MPHSSQRQQGADPATQEFMAELIMCTARATSLTIETFLHHNFGSGYLGCGLLGFVLIWLFSLCYQPQYTAGLFWFAVAYGVFWLVALINVWIRRWRGDYSVQWRYTGRPYLSRLLPNWREVNVKQVEALLAMGVGYAVCWVNRPLGHYLLLASTFVLLRAYRFAAQLRSRAVELNDSVLQEQIVAERFREMQESKVS